MKSDNILSVTVLAQFIFTIGQLILPLLGLCSVESAAILRVAVTLLTFIPAIYMLWLHLRHAFVITFVCFFVVMLFSAFFFPVSRSFIESSQAWTLTPITLLTGLCICGIKNFSVFHRALLITSRICAILALIYFVAFALSPYKDPEDRYSMSFSYAMLMPIMYLFTQRNGFDKLSSFLSFVLILFVGSRGAAAMALLFYGIYMVVFDKRSAFKFIIVVVLLTPVIVSVLPRVMDVESSRTIYLIMEGEAISHDSDRSEIHQLAKNIITQRPIIGWGVGADREIMGTFCHNIYLELSVHYGVLVSSFLSLVFIVMCLHMYNRKRYLAFCSNSSFFTMLLFYGFFPMLVSGSYLIDFKFAMLIGFLLVGETSLYKKKIKFEYENL